MEKVLQSILGKLPYTYSVILFAITCIYDILSMYVY